MQAELQWLASLFPGLCEGYALGQGRLRTQRSPLFQLCMFGGLPFLSASPALGLCQAPVGGGVGRTHSPTRGYYPLALSSRFCLPGAL